MIPIETAIKQHLADCEWHSLHEICGAIAHHVPLESAMRQWRNKNPNRKLDEDKLAMVVIDAKWQKVAHAVSKLAFHLRHGKTGDRLEVRGPRANREYRYVKAEASNATND